MTLNAILALELLLRVQFGSKISSFRGKLELCSLVPCAMNGQGMPSVGAGLRAKALL